MPEHIRGDNRPKFTATTVCEWLTKVGVKTLFIELAGPWENGYMKSFNGKLCDELLNGLRSVAGPLVAERGANTTPASNAVDSSASMMGSDVVRAVC